jgi:hypothetical protein
MHLDCSQVSGLYLWVHSATNIMTESPSFCFMDMLDFFLHYIEFNLLESPMCGLSSCDCCGKSAIWQSRFWSPSIWQLQTDLKSTFNLNFPSEKCSPIGRVMAIVAVLVELGTVRLACSAGLDKMCRWVVGEFMCEKNPNQYFWG